MLHPPAALPGALTDIRSRNEAALRRHHPAAARRILDGLPAGPAMSVVRGPCGEAGLRAGGTWIEGPAGAAEAARIAAERAGVASAKVVLVFGLGAGHLVLETLRLAAADARVVLVLIDTGSVAATLVARDLADALVDPRLEIAAGELRDIVAALPRTSSPLSVVAHPPLLALTAPPLQPLADMAAELTARHASSSAQREDVLSNVERNLAAAIGSPPAGRLVDVIRDRPALLVAPGPSLERDAPLLARGARPAVVALDTAVRSLLAAGITPDLAVTIDPTPGNTAKFDGVPADLPLAFFDAACPEVVDRHRARVFACETGGLLDRAHPWFGREGAYESAGSVLHAALDMLLALGAAPVALVGADLAPSGGAMHAGGAADVGVMPTRIVPARDGGAVATTESLWRHRRRLVRRLASVPAGRVVDATSGGASLGATARVALGTFLDEHGEAGRASALGAAVAALEPERVPAVTKSDATRAVLAAIRTERDARTAEGE